MISKMAEARKSRSVTIVPVFEYLKELNIREKKIFRKVLKRVSTLLSGIRRFQDNITS